MENISYWNRFSFNARFITEHFFGKTFFKHSIQKWSKKNQYKINGELEKGSPTILTVPTFQGSITPDEFRIHFLNKGKPVLIKGGAKNWKATKEWDFDFFKNNYGDHPVLLTNDKELGDESDKESELTTLSEIIDGLEEQSNKYARFNPLLNAYPELTESFDQEWLAEAIKKRVQHHHALFIGSKGTKTNIHNAGDENIFVMLRGKKKWFIWDHKAIYGISPSVNRAPAKASGIDPYEGDAAHFAFKNIPKYEVEIEEGDILFIPSYLWHYVENLTPSIGVGIRWLSAKNSIRNLPLLAFLEIFNTSPSIFKVLKFNKGNGDFNKILAIMKKEKMKKS